jgi:hypothetical protein
MIEMERTSRNTKIKESNYKINIEDLQNGEELNIKKNKKNYLSYIQDGRRNFNTGAINKEINYIRTFI